MPESLPKDSPYLPGMTRSFWVRCHHKAPITLNIPFLADIPLGFLWQETEIYSWEVQLCLLSTKIFAQIKMTQDVDFDLKMVKS